MVVGGARRDLRPAGVEAAAGLPPIGDLEARQLPFDQVSAKLEETLELIAASGLLG